MKQLFLLSSILLLSNAALCSTWIGGTGNWSNPNNWDTGQIPNVNDQVYIFSGTVNVHKNAACSRLALYPGAQLTIHEEVSLEVFGNSGLYFVELDGTVKIFGQLIVSNIAFSFSPNYGIKIGGNIENNGLIKTEGLADKGIDITASGVLENEMDIIIEGAQFGLMVQGTLINRNSIEVHDVEEHGIRNLGTFDNSNGHILIDNAGNVGFSNETAFTNEGEIYIYNSGVAGFVSTVSSNGFTNSSQGVVRIENYEVFGMSINPTLKNYGEITIHGNDNQMSTSFGLYTIGNGYNYATGEIKIYDFSGNGFNIASLFKNYGFIDIDVDEDHVGISNSGNFRNLGTGRVRIDAFDTATGFRNDPNGLAVNQSNIYIDSEGDNSLNNMGIFRNRFGGLLQIDNNNNTNIRNAEQAVFLNRNARIILRGSLNTIASIENSGSFTNDRCSYLQVENKIDNHSNASFVNNAYLSTSSPQPTYNQGSFDNNGILEDPANAFNSTSVNNNGVLIVPVSTPAYVGQPVFPALGLGSLVNTTILGWYTDSGLSNSAGTYNASNNTFTPNAAAEGRDYLYLHLDLDYDINCAPAGFRVLFDQPIQALQAPPTPFSSNGEEYEMVIFPNPASSRIQISGVPPHVQQLQLYNTQGQLVRAYLRNEEPVQTLDIKHISSGAYWLRAIGADGASSLHSVVVR